MTTKLKKHRLNSHKQLRLLPGYMILSLWVLFTIVLVGWVVAASLSTTKEIFKGTTLQFLSGLHFENYVRAWNSNNVSVFFVNSLIYASIATFLLVLICSPAAYVLSRFRFFMNHPIQNSLIAATGVPIVMIILPLFGLVANMGILKQDITIRTLMIFLYVGINIPYTIIFLLSFFSNLPGDFEEAAEIDGCTPAKTFWKIMLPLAQPGIITVSVFNFINIWNEYFMSLIFASSEGVRPVAVGLYSMINSMRYTGDWSGLFASVILVFLPTFVLYLFMSNRIISGITGGGVKG